MLWKHASGYNSHTRGRKKEKWINKEPLLKFPELPSLQTVCMYHARYLGKKNLVLQDIRPIGQIMRCWWHAGSKVLRIAEYPLNEHQDHQVDLLFPNRTIWKTQNLVSESFVQMLLEIWQAWHSITEYPKLEKTHKALITIIPECQTLLKYFICTYNPQKDQHSGMAIQEV